jgi:hypothetical protein
MSRSYRIKVSQSLRRVIHAEDHVSTQLELLEILPCDQMAELLGRELQQIGFDVEDGTATRRDGDVTVTVELATGTVTVLAEGSQSVDLKGEKQGVAYEESQSHAKDNLRQQLTRELEENAARQEQALQNEVTEQLEAELANLRDELDTAVNRATAQALKQKAAEIGQIKEMTEDPQSGSLTIVVEV